MFDFSLWHKGHAKQYCTHDGRMLLICTTCGVAADVEHVSAKISPADSYLQDSQERLLVGALSPDVPFEGRRQK